MIKTLFYSWSWLRWNTSSNTISKFTPPAVEAAEGLKNKEFSDFLSVPELVFTSVCGANGKQFLLACKPHYEYAHNILSLTQLPRSYKIMACASHPWAYCQIKTNWPPNNYHTSCPGFLFKSVSRAMNLLNQFWTFSTGNLNSFTFWWNARTFLFPPSKGFAHDEHGLSFIVLFRRCNSSHLAHNISSSAPPAPSRFQVMCLNCTHFKSGLKEIAMKPTL